MNWLDIIRILIIAFIVTGGVILDIITIMDKEYSFAVSLFLCALVVLILFLWS